MGASASSPLWRSQAPSSKLYALVLHFSTANPDSETPELHAAKAIITVILIYIPVQSAGGALHGQPRLQNSDLSAIAKRTTAETPRSDSNAYGCCFRRWESWSLGGWSAARL